MGRRSAYEKLMQQQRSISHGQCNVTLFSVFTSYSIQKKTSKNGKELNSPPLLTIDDVGIVNFNEKTKKFQVDDIIYTRLRKNTIVNVCPYVPLCSEDEKSCYSTLLMHTPWPVEGEKCLLADCDSSIQRLKELIDAGGLPTYVQPMLIREQVSRAFRDNINHRCSVHDLDDGIEPVINGHNDDHDNVEVTENELNSQLNIENELRPGIQVMTNISQSCKQYFMKYIGNRQKKHLLDLAAANQINYENGYICHKSNEVVELDNSLLRTEMLNANVLLLTTEQLDAYETAVEYISGDNGKQLIMFVSGEGGTGKSYLISLILEYTRLTYGKQKGIYGSAIAVAPTGAAASVIGGFTWQSVYSKGISKKKKSHSETHMSPVTAKAVGAKLNGLKLIVLDEISMINLETLHEISERQKEAMISNAEILSDEEIEHIRSKPFGGLHVLFTGDLHQLKPIGGTPIYFAKPTDLLALYGQQIWNNLNEYKELTINTRFRNDKTPHMHHFLKGARIGKIDDNLLQIMNSRIMTTTLSAKLSAGPHATWIAHTRKEVKDFNDADFRNKVNEGAINYRIVASHTPATELISQPTLDQRKKLFSVYNKNGAPPFIDLAIGTRVSCTRNLGTQIGKNNNNNTLIFTSITYFEMTQTI